MKKSHPVLISVGVIAVLALGFAAYLVFGPAAMDFAGGKSLPLSAYQGASPSGVPAELKTASALEKGEYLTRAADCMVCHTAKGGTAYAGGRGFVLPFGTLYVVFQRKILLLSYDFPVNVILSCTVIADWAVLYYRCPVDLVQPFLALSTTHPSSNA